MLRSGSKRKKKEKYPTRVGLCYIVVTDIYNPYVSQYNYTGERNKLKRLASFGPILEK
jgi:hypothetical protein